SDSDKGRQTQLVSLRPVHEFPQHCQQVLDRLVALRLILGVLPGRRFRDIYLWIGILPCSVTCRNDGETVCASDINREQPVIAGEYPRRRKISRADQAGFVGIGMDGAQIDLDLPLVEDRPGTSDGDFAGARSAHAATDENSAYLLPFRNFKIAL